MQPLVSVVTITYNLVKANRGDSFRRAANSVLAQTYPHIEYLIIDGASTDGTLELFKNYEETGKLTVYSEPDSGIYNAMNKGLAKAKGKYIIFLNSDDYWHDPQGIEQSVRILEMTQADFSIAPHTLKSEDGHTHGICTPSPASFFADMPFCHQTMLARTELLREVGGFDESFKIAADYDLTTRLLLRGAHPVFLPLNFTTFSEGGISNKKDILQKQVDEKLRVFHKNYDTFIGPKRAEKLLKGATDDELLHFLNYVVHPSIAHQLQSRVYHLNSGRYLVTSGWAVRGNATMDTTRISGPFNIPMLTIRKTPDSTQYKLLGFLPFLSIRVKPLSCSSHVRITSLCGIPIMHSIYSERTTRKLLFGCFTIYKKRVR